MMYNPSHRIICEIKTQQLFYLGSSVKELVPCPNVKPRKNNAAHIFHKKL
jgi:hypothetical protein